MKRIAMVVAIVVMAAGACKKAQQSNTGGMAADSMKMADSTKMMAPADTSKMHATPAPAPAPAAAPAKPAAKPAAKPTRRP
jgi:hypothetical protein